MKIIYFLFVTLMFSISAVAQAQPPQAFNYQGIARDGSGAPLTNVAVSLRLSVLQGSLGSIVYQETQNITTSKLGVFSVEVGNGASQLGQLQDVDWGLDEYYIQTEMDPEGGTNYTLLGQAQLLSVPYALYAGKAASANNLWQSNGTGIHYNDGNVGIGTSSPDNKLNVEGDDPLGDDRIYIDLNNKSTSNRSLVMLNLRSGAANTSTSLQHFSDSYDFDGDTYTNFGLLSSTSLGLILRADDPEGVLKFMTRGNGTIPVERMRISRNGFLGIGTDNPQQKLTIAGNDNVGSDIDYLALNNTSLGNRSGVLMALSAGDNLSQTTIGHHSETYNLEQDKYTDFGQLHSTGAGLILRVSGDNGIIKFLAGEDANLSSIERMRLTTDGNLGVGTNSPASRIQVTDGDVFIENINKGVIMKSPNGNCWRMTINNDGSVNTTAITCPN
jgi:hypothetical protein